MNTPTLSSRSEHILAIAQRASCQAAMERVKDLIQQLSDLKGITHLLEYPGFCAQGPKLDISVRLLDSLIHDEKIDNGQLIRIPAGDEITAEDIVAANQTLQALRDALDASGVPYVLLFHLHGQEDVQLYYGGGNTWQAAIDKLTGVLAFGIQIMRHI